MWLLSLSAQFMLTTFVAATGTANTASRYHKIKYVSELAGSHTAELLVHAVQPDENNETTDRKSRRGEAHHSEEHKQHAEVARQKTYSNVKKIARSPEELPDVLEAYWIWILGELMPGYKFKMYMIINASIEFSVALLWFLLYFAWLYKNDRVESVARWQKQIDEIEKDRQDTDVPDIKPDLIFIFQRPGRQHKDEETLIDRNIVERCLARDHSDHTCFKVTEAAMLGCQESLVRRVGSKMFGLGTREDTNTDEESAAPPTYGSMRVAIMKDLYMNLNRWGFDVQLFTSIDNDKIFMCASLTDKETSSMYIIQGNVSFQIQPHVVSRLGIDQPSEEAASSPPYLQYDHNLVQELHEAGILDKNDERELYRLHYGRSKDGDVISGRERIRVMLRKVSSHFNMDNAKTEGLMVDWYPTHSRHRLDELCACWANFRFILDISYVQPIPVIREYFGSRIAFNFAWNGFHCKCLLALLPVAMANCVFILVAGMVGWVHSLTERQVIGFSIVLALWSRVAYNLWEREQNYFLRHWDMDRRAEQNITRPEYFGYPTPSPLDRNETDKQYPRNLSIMRQLLSGSVTLLYSVFVAFMIVVWVNKSLLENGQMSITAAVVLAMQIKVFELVYNLLAEALTNFENHRFSTSYYNSYLWKQIFFQSVNYYMPFIYLAVMQRRHEAGCPKEGCTAALRVSLTITLVIICACRLAEVTVMAYKVKFTLWWERRQLEKQGLDIPHLSFTEEQAKYGEYRTREQVEAVLELVLSLGYVLIFGAVAPITVVFCLLVFVVQMRASAYLLTSSVKRTLPRRQNGIGAWNEVVGILMKIAIIFEAFLLISVGASFKGAAILAKVTGFIVFLLCMVVLWGAIDFILPPVDDETTLLGGRRDYAHRVILQRSGMTSKTVNKPGNQSGGWGCKKRKSQTESSIGAATVLTEDACNAIIETDGWDQIPHLDGTPAKHEEDGAASQR
eukprot:gnl/TRDRNA2_/TRDRNA2_164860_c0_seq4.p1 gnl/TRDRNA2_/TRDRNA2_164860_c0~~gnl/TRDRNA2_/TRDRNA2_164860_c0_seq4.p1  ORF type:complete len:962 (-),score=158.54 gnl/TRDRNA2_/TRDRNA2_164860_c0_seq4:151-3036(-)